MPPPVLDRARVEHVAALAALTLTNDEAESLAVDLAAIVRHVEELAEVDVDGVPPFEHAKDLAQPWRPDAAAPGLQRDEALAGAPRAVDGAFAVPGFVE